MTGYHKDKKTNKWFCDECNKEVDEKTIFAPYNYFGENVEHVCEAIE